MTLMMELKEQRREGREEGREEAMIHNLRALMKSMKLTKEAAMDALELTAEMRAKVSPML